jgi:predicted extracellular nuclease
VTPARLAAAAVAAALTAGVGGSADAPTAPDGPTVAFLGRASLPTGLRFADTEVGGLSGLSYDARTGRYLAVSDDRSERSPARVYTLSIDLSRGQLGDGDVAVVGVTVLRTPDGQVFAESAIDGEGVAVDGEGGFFVSSEGEARSGVGPFVRRFAADGAQRAELPLPDYLQPSADGRHGVRDNLALESLTRTPDGDALFTASENALAQDGPRAGLASGSLSRIVKLALPGGEALAEYLYPVGPVAAPPNPVDAFRANGLADLLALDGETLLALERSFSVGIGYAVRIYAVSLAGATDVRGVDSTARLSRSALVPARKRLLLDLAALGLELPNLEGITLGPALPDGRRALVLVSDNNFGRDRQPSQLFAFAIDGDPGRTPVRRPRVPEIQGRGHASPLFGEEVAGVRGVVTAVLPPDAGPGFWLQDRQGDGDAASSDAVFVVTAPDAPPVRPGAEVVVDGRVDEVAGAGELPVTRLVADRVESVGQGATLPVPVVLGRDGRQAPATVDDDGLARFEPERDAIDFFESLEGMRVEVRRPVVIGPTSRHGEAVVLADDGGALSPRTARGGLALAPDADHAGRLIVDDRVEPGPPLLLVGDRLDGTVRGVLDYAFGTYRILNDAPLPPVRPGGLEPETTALAGGRSAVTVATFNVENLAFPSPAEKFAAVAATIARNLGGPDIVALQEIQDDSGPADDGVVSAARTLDRLVEAIVAAGGRRYAWRQIDPEDRRDGGQPGGNIRVAFLFDPARVGLADRGAAGPRDACTVDADRRGALLPVNPCRVAPADPAWQGRPEAGGEGARKPLAAEFDFAGRRLFLVNLHLSSKLGDDRQFGAVQPPRQPTGAQRVEQARLVREFVGRILAVDPEAAVVILGDCNDFDFAPPLQLLAAPPLESLYARLPRGERYTYVFQGSSQALDHVVVSAGLARRAEVDAVHVNAEFPERDRGSDHDPVVARLHPRD